MHIIFSFGSRAQAMRLYSALKRTGIPAAVINTPRQVSLGCGLSVKIDESRYAEALGVLKMVDNDAFLGAFRLHNENGRLHVERL